MLKKYKQVNPINLTLSDHKNTAFYSFPVMNKQKNANCFCPSSAELVLLGHKEAGPSAEEAMKNIRYQMDQLDYLFSWLFLKC